jgi:hypothetical protein
MSEHERESGSSERSPFDAYRESLIKCLLAQSEQWDKTILWMASGALAISLAFIKEMVSPESMINVKLLGGAWACLILSLLCVLVSFYTSMLAMRKAIRQLDDKDLYLQTPGGWADRITNVLNPGAGALLLAGLVCLVWFSYSNLKNVGSKAKQQTQHKN